MLLVTAGPLLVVCVLLALLVVPVVTTIFESNEFRRKVLRAAEMSSLVHEQQKERGATSVFLSSGGTKFVDELAAQRKTTDALRSVLVSEITTEIEGGRDASGKLAGLLSDLRALDALRLQVDDLELSAGAAVGRYTALNKKVIASVRSLSNDVSDLNVSSGLFALSSFLEGKDRAGLERAVGARSFARGGFADGDRELFQKLINFQELYFELFKAQANPEIVAQYDDAMAGQAAQFVAKLRTKALSGEFDGVTATEFFEAETQKINALKAIEDQISARMGVELDALVAQAWWQLALKAAGALAAISISAFVALAVSRALRTYMIAVSGAAEKLSSGNLETDIPAASASEIGTIARALEAFRESIVQAREADAEKLQLEAEARQLEADSLARKVAREAKAQEEAASAAEAQREREREEYDAAKRATEDRNREANALRLREEAIAAEIYEVVEACAAGRFDARISLQGKEGLFADLCSGVNRIGDSTEAALDQVLSVMRSLSKGDLTSRMKGNFDGVFADIAVSVNETIASLEEIVSTIRSGGERVRASTEALQVSATDLAKRTERSAATLETTNAALTELEESVVAAADIAEGAKSQSGNVMAKSDAGISIATKTSAAITEIKEASTAITQIIDMINGISFQTNLLALNAGVEAARAGDAGRGFAVVATEVRALAARSTEAAKGISELIATSGDKVDDGVKLVENGRSALDEISSSITGIVENIEQLANSTEHQKNGIQQVAAATDELDRTTQQNARMFDETTRAIDTTLKEVDTLLASVRQFSVSQNDTRRRYNAAA